MAKYRSLHTKLWTNPAFEGFAVSTKIVFVYLLTNANRSESGIYNITRGLIAYQCGISVDDVTASLDALGAAGMVRYDVETSTVWVVNAAKHQALNGNCVKSIANDLRRCASPSIVEAFARYYRHLPALAALCCATLGEPLPDPSATRDEPFANPSETHSVPFSNPPLQGTGYRVQGEDVGGTKDARDAEPADIDPNNPQHIPPDVEAVVAAGAMIGKDRATCESFHAHYASQGWVKANNRPITNWPLVLRIWTVEDAAGQSPRKGGKGGSPPTTYPARMLTSDAALKLGVERGVRSWQRDWPRYRGPNGKAWHVHPDDLARPIPDGYTPWPIDAPATPGVIADPSATYRATTGATV